MNNEAEVFGIPELHQNFRTWFGKQIKSKRKILVFSFVAAGIVATLTTDLSPRFLTKITVIATGRKTSEQAKAAVIWIKNPNIEELREKKIEIRKSTGWMEWDGIFISNRDQPAEIKLEGYFPRDQVFQFIRTRHSGEARFEVNGRITTLDLYAEKPSLVTIPLDKYISEHDSSAIQVLIPYGVALVKFSLLFLFLAIALHPIYSKLPAPQVSSIKLNISKPPRGAIYLMALSIAVFLLLMAAFYPGAMASDAYQQYMEAVLFRFDDWHPPIMALLWAFTNKIVSGAAGMFLLHLIMGTGSFYLLSRVALAKGKKLYFLPMFAVFLPFVSCLIFNIIKDVACAVSLLFAFSLWYFWVSFGKLTKPKLLLILVILFYGSSVRLNALPAAIPLLFLFVKDFTSTKKAIAFAFLLGLLFQAGNDLLSYRILNAKKIYTIQAVISHNLMGIYRFTGKNYFPPGYLKQDHLDSLMKRYDPISLDPSTWVKDAYMTTDPRIISELKEAWISAILKEPAAYLNHRWILFKSFLKDVVYIIQQISYPEPEFLPQRAHPLLQETSLGKLNTRAVFWMYHHARFVYQAITYLLASVALLGIAVYRKSLPAIALNLSSLFYFAPYFFVAPAANYRYVYWCMLTVLVSITVLWIETSGHGDPKTLDAQTLTA